MTGQILGASRDVQFEDDGGLRAAIRRDGEVVASLTAIEESDGGIRIQEITVAPTESADEQLHTALLSWLLERTPGSVRVSGEVARPAGNLFADFGFQRASRSGDLELGLSGPELRVAYVYNAIGSAHGHTAHVPGLLEELGRHVTVQAVPYGSSAGIPRAHPSIGWICSFVRQVRELRRSGTRVVFVRIHWPLAAILRIAGLGRWKVVLWFSGGVGPTGTDEPSAAQHSRGRFPFRAVLRYGVDAVVTGPPAVLDHYASFYRLPQSRLVLVSNDVDLDRWVPQVGSGPEDDRIRHWLESSPRLLFVHSLSTIRGTDLLPGIVARLAPKHGNLRVLVAGAGDRDAFGLHESDGFDVIGAVPNSTVPALMAAADCVLIPSRQEGFPRVAVEAMAVETPPVCFAVGGCRDLVGPYGDQLVAPADDLDAFAAAVERVVSGESPLSPDGLRRRAQEFSTPVVARRLSLVLRLMAARGASVASAASRGSWALTFRRPNDA